MLTSPNLASVTHGFFTRQGGVSGGIYASLNCGRGSGDDKLRVEENRRRVAEQLDTTPRRLCSLYQVHGTDVIIVEEPWLPDAPPRADAMVTQIPGIALGILTADCVPVLLADMEAGVIGATHAGWRGALAGVLGVTVAAMQSLGAQSSRIKACIGPAIAQASYEVGRELKETFMQKNPAFIRHFVPAPKADHFRLDVKGFCRERLREAGISAINLLENDTYLEEDAFFSFRRATHKGEADYGRQISAIMLPK
jgi:polyphenol oxidase